MDHLLFVISRNKKTTGRPQPVANIHTPAQEEECWLSYATRGMELRRIGADEGDSANEMLRRSVEISTGMPFGVLRVAGLLVMISSYARNVEHKGAKSHCLALKIISEALNLGNPRIRDSSLRELRKPRVTQACLQTDSRPMALGRCKASFDKFEDVGFHRLNLSKF